MYFLVSLNGVLRPTAHTTRKGRLFKGEEKEGVGEILGGEGWV